MSNQKNIKDILYYGLGTELELLFYEEVERVIKQLKSNYVPGEDDVHSKKIKQGGMTLWRFIHELIIEE